MEPTPPRTHLTHPEYQAGLIQRIDRRIRSTGEMKMPCAPALLDNYLKRTALLFTALGKPFSEEEILHYRDILLPKLEEGFAESAHNFVLLTWKPDETPGGGLDYQISLVRSSIIDQYEWWAENKTPPLFGSAPDARLMATLDDLPRGARILDVGAGTGRNTFPIAAQNFRVDALELTPSFAEQIRQQAASSPDGASVRVLEGSVFDLDLEPEAYACVFASEVTSHFRGVEQLQAFFERAKRTLAPRGLLLINAFLTEPGYAPTPLDRQLSSVHWSTLFTRAELLTASRGMTLVLDESAYAFEREHLPEHAWPPTGWFPDWSRGYDTYRVSPAKPPMELRWLLFEKT